MENKGLPHCILVAAVLNCGCAVVKGGWRVGFWLLVGAGGEGEEHAGLAGVGGADQDAPDVGGLRHPAPAANSHWSTGYRAVIAGTSSLGAAAELDRPGGQLSWRLPCCWPAITSQALTDIRCSLLIY